MRKRVLVTGGAGFLGSHLCERIVREGGQVICLDDFSTGRPENLRALVARQAVRVIRRDICHPIYLEVDEVFHLACPASPRHYQRDPVQTILTCIEGTRNALEIARRSGARILIASTSEIYGEPLTHPQPESYWGNVNPLGPRACYDEGKRCAESLAVAYAQQHGTAVRIARIFNTYGPRLAEDDGRVVSTFISQALRGAPLTVFGDGRQTRSFCYVDDLVEGFLRLMGSAETEPVNLGNPEEVSMCDLARLVIELAGSASNIAHRPLPVDDPSRRRPDTRRAAEQLGWRATTSLEEGVLRTISDFRSRLCADTRRITG